MKFTVLMPVFNTPAPHLFTSFYSILNQKNISSYDILIVDDASDNEETIRALEFIANYPNVKVIRHETNRGSAAARNTGIAAINTEYIALMDSDDISFPNRFRAQWDYIKANKPDVLGTNLLSFTDETRRTSIFKSKHLEIPEYNNGWMVNQGTVFYKREVVLAVGGYNESLRRAQDIDLWKRINKAGYKLRNITEILYAWRRR